jgi:uncharacterized protein YbbC (DUF1343 family)
MESVRVGLDRFEREWPRALRGARVGLLAHPASVNGRLEHAVSLFLKSRECHLTALFGPQHGINGQTQDNMVEWEGFRDEVTGLPVFSLYGANRKPQPFMLKDVDALVIDLQDVGSRYYTFIWTMELCMEACAEAGTPVVILDRPNPIGGTMTEGPVLSEEYASRVVSPPYLPSVAGAARNPHRWLEAFPMVRRLQSPVGASLPEHAYSGYCRSVSRHVPS